MSIDTNINLRTSKIGYTVFFLILQLLTIFSIFYSYYIFPAILILCLISIFIVNNIQKSLYLLLFSMIFVMNFTLFSIGDRSIGINLDYIILPILITAWILRKIFGSENFKNSVDRTNYLKTPITVFSIICFISIIRSSFDLNFSQLIDGIVVLISWIEYAFLLFIVSDLVGEPNQIKKMILVMLALAFLVAVIGVIEYFVFRPVRIQSLFGSFFRRAPGAPNALGAYLAIFALFFLVFSFHFKGYMKIFMVSGLVVLVWALVLTLSRSSWLGFLIGFVYIILKQRNRRVIIGLPALILILALIFPGPVTHRFESIFKTASNERIISKFISIDYRILRRGMVERQLIPVYGIDIASSSLRYSAWTEALNIFKKHPLLGTGFFLERYFGNILTAENLYLELLASIGIFGFLSFIWLIVRIVRFTQIVDDSLRESFHKYFILGYKASLWVIAVVSLTGSIAFGPKILGAFWFLTGLLVSIDRLRTTDV